MTKENKIGLCLSGGGARGFAHLGVLQAFDEAGYGIDMISGSSAGAFVAALYGAGYSPSQILNDTMSRGLWKYIQFKPNKLGFLDLDKTDKILKSLIPENSFESLKIPISICATNISKGTPQYFSEGSLIDKVLASAAIPVIFKPIMIAGDKFLDGGLSDNLPVKPLQASCSKIIAVDVTPLEKRLPVRSMKDLVLKTIYLNVEYQTKFARSQADLVIVPDHIMKFDGMKLKNAEKLFDLGYLTTQRLIKNGEIVDWHKNG